ncbi:MAG: DUF4437 domain-containing protein [Xenococcaceae cyanobacterium]
MNSTTLKQWQASIIGIIAELVIVMVVLAGMLLQADSAIAQSAPATFVAENGESIITDLSTVTWSAYPGIPEGAELAVLRGDPATDFLEAVARFPAGYLFPHHYHTSRELLIFLEGDFTYINDDGTAQIFNTNAYLNLPSRTKHSLRCGAEPCLLYARYDGPYDLILSPAPKKQMKTIN